jgi:hypothetical protein
MVTELPLLGLTSDEFNNSSQRNRQAGRRNRTEISHPFEPGISVNPSHATAARQNAPAGMLNQALRSKRSVLFLMCERGSLQS